MKRDLIWILEKIQNSDDLKLKKIWLQFISFWISRFDYENSHETDAIITAMKADKLLYEELKLRCESIELDSDTAIQLKAEYYQCFATQTKTELIPSPKERVLQCLKLLEDNDLSRWWQLNREMTLISESRYYGEECELDLTKLPGWKEAEQHTRKRIINGAKKYIQQQNEITYEWIGTNQCNLPTIAGCKALLLLLQEDIEFLETVTTEIWQKWAPAIIAFPSGNKCEENYLELISLTYSKVPEKVIETLLFIIDKENQNDNYIYIVSKFSKCWDDRLKLALFNKAKDESLKPKCMGQLLKELLEHGFDEARQYLESLVSSSLPLLENEREKAIIASQVLLNYVNPSILSVLWSVIEQDSSFGRAIFESNENHFFHSINSNLSEEQLANLFIWLVCQYPYNEDPEHSNDVTYWVSSRDRVADFRNGILERLKNVGTIKSCNEIKLISYKFSELTWLKKVLIDAQNIMRRKTWQPLMPENIIQLIAIQRKEKLMNDQSNLNFSGATFNAPVNLAPNYGNQAQNLSIYNTEQKFELYLADFNQFVTDLKIRYPNVNTSEAATQTISSQAKLLPKPRWQNFLNLKHLSNGAKKAGLKVGEHFAEDNVWGKGAIAFLEGMSEEL